MKEAYYFSHDSNARHDPNIIPMRGVYGAEGYGWYWILVEMMRDANGYRLDMQGKYIWNAYAQQMGCMDIDRAKQFIMDCIEEFKLFASDGEFFWSNSLIRRMEKREKVNEKRREAANARWANKADLEEKEESEDAETMQMHSDCNADGMQGKESKGNKNKGNKRKGYLKDNPPVSPQGERARFVAPSLDEVAVYCNERGKGVDAEKWFDHYTSNGWKVGRNPMKDWKAAVRTWEKGDGNYAKSRASPERGRGEFDSLSL